jgi:hypothetical protein
MDAADLIYQEVRQLPESLCAEVLDFIGYLRSRHPVSIPPTDKARKVNDLEMFFAAYQCDLSHFHFNRDEANER